MNLDGNSESIREAIDAGLLAGALTLVWQGGSPEHNLRLRHSGTVVHLQTWKGSSTYLDRRLRWDWTRFSIDASVPAPGRLDAVQVIENARLTGALAITGDTQSGRVLFNEGRIIGAESGDAQGEEAFRMIVEVTDGSFEFEISTQAFPVTIQAASNTNLILDSLRQLDEENK